MGNAGQRTWKPSLIDSDGRFGEERTNSYGWFQFFGPRPNIAGIFPANLDLLAAFKKDALSRKTGEKVK